MVGTRFPTSPVAIVRSFSRNRSLIWQMTKREVIGRYRGSLMGILWSFLNPIFMLAVYTFVFSYVFKSRWGASTSDSKTEFAILLFTGLIIHGLFSECVNRAPSLILGNVNYVKKVVFPLEVLPWVAMGATVFHTGVSILVLLTFYFSINLSLPWTLVFLPLLLFPLVLLTMGLSWFLASLGVYLRDVGQIIGLVSTSMLFLSPVFYPVSALPPEYRPLLHLNPLTFMIEQAREVMIWGRMPDWQGLAIYTACSLAVAWAGFFWFQKTRRGFADVL